MLAMGTSAEKTPKARASASANARYQRLEALLDGQSQVLEMISQGLPLSHILEAIPRWVEANSKDGVLASILLLDRDGQRLLHGGAPGLPETYNQAIHGMQIGPAAGSCGTAAFTGRAVIVEDIATNPLWADFRALALSHGLRACWSTPLIDHTGRVLGTFAMYYRQPRSPSEDDFHLIHLVTRTVVLAIEHQRMQDERADLLARERLALRRAEAQRQRLHDLIMEAPAAIALLRGPAHICEVANPMYQRTIGMGRDVLGKSLQETLPELEGQGIFELLDRVYATGERHESSEALFRLGPNDDGSFEDRYFNVVYQPTRDEAGAVDGVLIHAVDVTASTLAHQWVTASEERYRTLFRLVPVAIFACDASGLIQEYNQHAIELWGRAPVAGDPGERYCGSLKRYFSDGRPMSHEECPTARVLCGEALDDFDAECLIERPDGSRRSVVAHPQLLRNQHGQVTGVITCLYDITERKQADAAAAHLAAIVSSSSDAIASKTLEGIITSWNASAERMFGYTPEEIIGRSVLTLIPPERREEEDVILARIRAGEHVEHFETVRVRKDGRRLDVSLTISPIRDRLGAIMGASKIVRDITERKQLERERAELLGIVAHDLGNPLASIKARVQLLTRQIARGKALDADALSGLELLVTRMERLVRDLRDAESIEAGHLILVRDRFDLVSLLRQEAETTKTASQGSVMLELPDWASSGAVEVDADRDRIGQVIANLLSNAIKYSLAGQPVALSLDREKRPISPDTLPVSFVRVSVHDEGPGIPKEALSQVFERFYRVPGIDTRRGDRPGLGLGLYICRQLIERHGGQIGVESVVGRGSTFWFTLPLVSAAV
jgi:PAS domain S-box-containing protein